MGDITGYGGKFKTIEKLLSFNGFNFSVTLES